MKLNALCTGFVLGGAMLLLMLNLVGSNAILVIAGALMWSILTGVWDNA